MEGQKVLFIAFILISISLEFRRKEYFFGTLLPFIQQLALDLPTLVPKLPILVPSKEASITLHQKQIASILANAFFCTFDTIDPARVFNMHNVANCLVYWI